jgi:hypothetical protein
MVERENRSILNLLRKAALEYEHDWDIRAFGINFTLKTIPKRAHKWKHSPFYMMFMREPIGAPDLETKEIDHNKMLETIFTLSPTSKKKKTLKLQESRKSILQQANSDIKEEQVI